MAVEFLTLPDRRLAYQRLRKPVTAPQIVFLGGYASDMTGTKAAYLSERCREAGYGFLRFDYRGHGASDGAFADCTLGDWLADAWAVIDRLTTGPQILIGSSMGGWLALLLARDHGERVKALVGIAAAPDFTEDLIWDHLTTGQKYELQEQGWLRDGNGNAGLITLKLLDEARQHLVLRQPLPMTCPMRLLQGMQDHEVPWETAPRIAALTAADNVRAVLIKDGDHRLNRPQDLALVWDAVREFT